MNYKKGFINVIAALIIGGLAVATGALIDKYVSKPVDKVGAVNYVTGGGTYRLASSISSTQSTITLSSFREPVSNIPYTMTYLNSAKEYGTIDPQTSNSEFVSFTGITQNSDGTATLTGVSRGLSRSYPFTASSTFQVTHSGQATFILSNTPNIYNDIYDYINNATYSGTVDSSQTVKGIVEEATGAEAARHALDGSGNTTAPLVLTASIASSTRQTNTQQVVVASSTGYIDYSYIPQTYNAPITFSTSTATTTNIGAFPAYWIGKNGVAFTNTGYNNFAVPSGVNKVYVRMVGGGGGGAGSTGTTIGAGGGGAGEYAEGFIDITGTTSIAVYVGVGGTGGTAANPGGLGTTTSFGNYMTAVGGGGSGTGAGASGAGGTGGTGGMFHSSGGYGMPGFGGSTSFSSGGASGGASYFGSRGAYGSGGFGGNNSSAGDGGTQGIVIINW